jgi:hypothetical protein
MPKTKPRAVKTPAIERELTKWSCTLFGNKSEIDVFVESAGRWETAAEIRGVGKYDAEEVANFITNRLSQVEFMDVRNEAAKPPLTIRDD